MDLFIYLCIDIYQLFFFDFEERRPQRSSKVKNLKITFKSKNFVYFFPQTDPLNVKLESKADPFKSRTTHSLEAIYINSIAC